MADCSTMKKGEIYVCRDCGFTIEVVEECDTSNAASHSCSAGSACTFTCCGEDLVKKT